MGNTTVNWNTFEYRLTTGGKRRKHHEVTCGACGNTHMLRADDARKAERLNRPCKSCHTSAIGKIGYQVTAAKMGKDFALNAVAGYQLANPSKPEQQIADWLDEMGVSYTRQVIVELGISRYIVDFVLANGKGIEGAGGYWHAKNKQAKDVLLAAAMQMLFVTDDLVMNDPVNARALIAEYVK